METIYQFILWVPGFVLDLIEQFLAGVLMWFIYAFLAFSVWASGFAWDVAQLIIADLDLSTHINSAWSAMSPSTRQVMAFFRIPECINLLASFGVTKYVLRFIPFV